MKRFIDKILDVPKLIRTIWLMLWIILIILLILKFCFNQWYPIVVENKWFIIVCDYIDKREHLYYGISYVFYILNFIISYLTCRKLKRFNNNYIFIIFIIIALGIVVSKKYINLLGMALETSFIMLLPIILNIKQDRFKNTWLNVLIPIIFYLLTNLWQLTIFLVRGLNIETLNNYPALIPLILQLDYYIFITITWIGVNYMGTWGIGWLWSRDITLLKAEKQRELAKQKPDMDKVFKLEARIEKLEKESK